MYRILPTFMVGLVLLAAPVSAQDADAQLKFGESTFAQFCSHCHGLKMVNPGTSSFDLRKFPKDDHARFRSSVVSGKGNMPAWGDVLTEEELDALWTYVATRGGKEPLDDTEESVPADEADLHLLNEGALTTCLPRNGGVMSSKRGDGGVGLDYEVSAALATALGLQLVVTWFESEQEEESTPAKETYAMLAYGLCDISPGFALYAPAYDRYGGTRANLPSWDDRPVSVPKHFSVDLLPISLTKPYARMEIGLVRRAEVKIGPVSRIADLTGLRLGVEQGTLAGILTLRQGGADIVRDAVTLNPGPAFLWAMENGDFDAALVTVAAYDFHVRQNAVSTLVLDDYRHPLGFNLGIALLASNPALRDRLNAEIATLNNGDAFAAMAANSRSHYAPPREPYIQGQLTLRDILVTQ